MEVMVNIDEQPLTGPSTLTTGGYCRQCGREHRLGPGDTLRHGRELMRRLDRLGTIDLFSPPANNPASLSTTPLFGPGRGKMFGVLEALGADGTTVVLYAFSGQYHGNWLVEGWMPPLFNLDDFLALTVETEQRIKQLGRTIDRCVAQSSDWLAARKKRRLLSRNLMSDIHNLYTLRNFRGQTTGLQQAFTGGNGIPTGTGDCCAPKLLNFAAKNDLRPLGICEFFWGRENRSAGHRHGSFTSSCMEKCRPILGFMLCGLDDEPLTGR